MCVAVTNTMAERMWGREGLSGYSSRSQLEAGYKPGDKTTATTCYYYDCEGAREARVSQQTVPAGLMGPYPGVTLWKRWVPPWTKPCLPCRPIYGKLQGMDGVRSMLMACGGAGITRDSSTIQPWANSKVATKQTAEYWPLSEEGNRMSRGG